MHRFRAADVEQAVAKGRSVTAEAREVGESAIEEYFFRNLWLALSLVGIAFVVLALVLKVRQVDRRWRAQFAARASRSPS